MLQHMLSLGSLDHINVVRILGICPGDNLQLVTPLSSQGSLLEHIKHRKNNLSPQRLLNWCVQIAKVNFCSREHFSRCVGTFALFQVTKMLP